MTDTLSTSRTTSLNTSLAARRQALLARCAEQRVDLALELQAARAARDDASPFATSAIALLGARLLADKRLAIGAAGTALALAFVRPARLLRVARLATSGWQMARNGLALVARYRQ